MDQRRDRLLPGVASLVAFALLASACGSDGSDSSAEAESTPTTEAAQETTTTEFDDSEVELTNEQAEPEEEASTTSEVEAEPENEPVDESQELFPDVVDATATLEDDGTWTFNATLSSPYDSPARYADAWRVVGPDGTEYGIRVLTHDHANEQPFTRSESGIAIPDDITTVTIEGRDQVSGWGGATFEVELAR